MSYRVLHFSRTALSAAFVVVSVAGCLDRTTILTTSDAGNDASQADGEQGANADLDHGAPRLAVPPPVATGRSVQGLAIANGEIYWSELGTFDELGNYRKDGAVLAIPIEIMDLARGYSELVKTKVS